VTGVMNKLVVSAW